MAIVGTALFSDVSVLALIGSSLLWCWTLGRGGNKLPGEAGSCDLGGGVSWQTAGGGVCVCVCVCTILYKKFYTNNFKMLFLT